MAEPVGIIHPLPLPNIPSAANQPPPRPSWYKKAIETFSGLFMVFHTNEVPLRPVFSEEFCDLCAQLPSQISGTLKKRLQFVNENEQYVGKYLREKLDASEAGKLDIFQTALKGGYIQIDDGGRTFRDWRANLKNLVIRDSSHESSGEIQYAFRGVVVIEFLFSTKIVDKGTDNERLVTWFQMERHPMKFGFVLRHMWGWAVYKWTQRNQGPYGDSEYREANPLVVKLKQEHTQVNSKVGLWVA